MIYKYDNFIDESYLSSNFAPIYHFTNHWSLESILEDNKLNTGWVENPFFKEVAKIISFTRNKNLDISYYKDDLDIIICLDKNKLLLDGYVFYPYDFFIQSGREIYSKSNIKRRNPYEFEEATKSNIENIYKYIIYVDFLYDSLYKSYKSVNILKEKNIEIYEAGRRIS